MYEINSWSVRSQILTCFIFLVLFSKNITVSLKKATLQKKNVTAKEELDCIYINDIVNSEDSPRLVFIDEKYGNLIVINDGGELTRNNQKKMQTFYIAWRCPPSDKSDVAGESIYSVTMWNIYCESVR